MGVKSCTECGSPFESKAANAKRCPRCRSGRAGRTSVLGAVEATLASIGKQRTTLGAAAVVLAARLDAGVDPGSAMAAMSKELRTMMLELTRSAPAVSDPVDELRQRRTRRIAGLGG